MRKNEEDKEEKEEKEEKVERGILIVIGVFEYVSKISTTVFTFFMCSDTEGHVG